MSFIGFQENIVLWPSQHFSPKISSNTCKNQNQNKLHPFLDRSQIAVELFFLACACLCICVGACACTVYTCCTRELRVCRVRMESQLVPGSQAGYLQREQRLPNTGLWAQHQQNYPGRLEIWGPHLTPPEWKILQAQEFVFLKETLVIFLYRLERRLGFVFILLSRILTKENQLWGPGFERGRGPENEVGLQKHHQVEDSYKERTPRNKAGVIQRSKAI